MEEKIKLLANTIVVYSLKLKSGEKVLIKVDTLEPRDLVSALIHEISRVGAIPTVEIVDPILQAKMRGKMTEAWLPFLKKKEEFIVNMYDAFISIRYRINDYEEKNTSSMMLRMLGDALYQADDIRINHKKWVLLNYPSILDSYKAKMTIEEFREYALSVMTVDYQQMYQQMLPLKRRMEQADQVRIVSPGTDLTFSIKGMPAIPCCGDKNIPDGEIYTAPIKHSVNGTITYNTPSPYRGNIFHHVSLTFQDGKIIKATCDEDDEVLNAIFDTDEGARYIGEFSFGFNPQILNPMGDILYDEKILGSIHFTPGRCYKDCDNQNRSSIHWDMVLIQRSEYGGGEIYFDQELIRKDGKFIPEDLQPLNGKMV